MEAQWRHNGGTMAAQCGTMRHNYGLKMKSLPLWLIYITMLCSFRLHLHVLVFPCEAIFDDAKIDTALVHTYNSLFYI